MLTPVVTNKSKLKVYDTYENNFDHNGLGVLFDAVEPKVSINIDGTRTLEFQLNFKSPSWRLIRQGNIVKVDDQLYRIANYTRKNGGDEISQVTCFHVFGDSAFFTLNEFPKDVEEVKIDTVRNLLVEAFEGSRFNIMSEPDVASRGMIWVPDLIEFEVADKTTAGEVLSQVFTKIEKGELYVDNWSIAVVQRLGRNKGVRLSETVNTESIEEDSDYSELYNILTVSGKDGLPLPDTYPSSVLRSEQSISIYGERMGYLDFDQIEDKVELLAMAEYAISPTNADRIDMPKSSIKVSYIDLAKLYKEYPSLGVGDTVFVPSELTVEPIIEARITQIDYYPLSPENSSITVGNPPRTLTDMLGSAVRAGESFHKVTDERGRIKMSWLDGIKQTYRQYIGSLMKELQIVEHLTGDIWLHPNGETAIFIGGGVMAFANAKTPEGEWAWNTFLSANDVTSDMGNFAQLNTGVIQIRDDEGYMNIFSSMLEMYSLDPTDPTKKILRMMQGVDPGDNIFKYVVYDQFGEPVIYFDANGELQVKGRIETGDVLTNNLYGENGYISYLTVDSIETSDFVERYNLKDNSPVNYFKGHKQWLEFYTSEVIGASTSEGSGLTEQLRNRNGQLVFWQEDPHATGSFIDAQGVRKRASGQRILTTTAQTAFPVSIYKYTHLLKMKQGFTDGGNPYIEMGVGTGDGSQKGKAVIVKTSGGVDVKYVSTSGIEYGHNYSEAGVEMLNGDNLIQQIRNAKHIPLALQVLEADPVNAPIGSIWLVDDFV